MVNRLKQVRASLGITQKTMSARLGLGTTTWQSYELGKNLPGTEIYLKLAQMGYSIDWILTGAGTMLRTPLEEKPPGSSDILTPNLIFQISLALEEFLAEEGLTRYIKSEERANLLKLLCKVELKSRIDKRLAGESPTDSHLLTFSQQKAMIRAMIE